MDLFKIIFSCFIIYIVKGEENKCTIIKLSNSSITANLNRAAKVDEKNFDPNYAILDNDKAFCAKVESKFYMQIDFGSIKTITNVVVQGFQLNGTNLMLYAFVLHVSLDGKNWYHYGTGTVPKYFLVHFASSGKPNEKMNNPFEEPVMGRYVRLVPHWPMSDIEHKFCIRLQFTGCGTGRPPIITAPHSIATKVGNRLKIKCVSVGQIGLNVKWKGQNGTFNSLSDSDLLKRDLTSELSFSRITYGDLPAFQCTKMSSYIHCVKNYTCEAYYSFNPKLRQESKTRVTINITLPDRPTNFFVKTKNRTGVMLSWFQPALNDFDQSMLEYEFACNATGKIVKRIFLLNKNEIFVGGLGIYRPYVCSLKLQLNNNSRKFLQPLKQKPVVTHFHSLSIKPSAKPSFHVAELRPESIRLEDIKVNFSKRGNGRLSGFLILATMLYYGNRDPQLSSVVQTTWKRKIKHTETKPTVSFNLEGLKPWSIYTLSVTAYNDDDLPSNTMVAKVTTPEGKPSAGPDLRYISGTSSSFLLAIISFEMKDHNGIILSYNCSLNPGNQVFSFQEKSKAPFEFTNLKPHVLYEVKCKARTNHSFGPYGSVFRKRTLEDRPEAPTNIVVRKNTKNLVIQWSAPEHTNGNISSYEVQIVLVNHTQLSFYATSKQMGAFNINIPKMFVNKVAIRAINNAGIGPWSDSMSVKISPTKDQTQQDDDVDNIVMIIAFSVAIVFLALLVLLCFMHYRRRYPSKRLFPKDKLQMEYISPHRLQCNRDVEDADEDTLLVRELSEISNDCLEGGARNACDETHQPLAVEEFPEYINLAKQDEHELLLEEFKNKLTSGKCYPWQVADRPENGVKNRYTNIAAYDHSRVILKHDFKRKTSDYINANTLGGYNYMEDSSCRYISTQGPTPSVLGDFWLMVWQEEIPVIVMLTNLNENDKVKCAQYWPSEGSVKYGNINVIITNTDRTADYVIRTFVIEKTASKEARTVLQFHFVSWPDHGTPDYPAAILSLRRRVKHYNVENKPVLVHCSAGVGRSGCFILIDAMLERIDKERNVDIFNYLRYMRSRRINMVQTFEQYIFAHNAILEYITFGNTEIIVDDLDKKTRELIRGPGMANEFSILSRNTQPDPYIGNVYKVFLPGGKFVEAYKVDGYKHRDAFILTTAPTESNVDDFWRMVLEKQCHTIVMLNRCQETSQEYFKYWPDTNCAYSDMDVALNSEVANGNIITRKIKVTSSKSRCEVHHFQYVGWPDSDIPNKRAYNNLCTLMQAVEKSQQNLGNGPIIVHAGNDYGRSGTFVAVYNSTERLKVEQLIDVLQCVRAIRISQPLAVDNVTQYQFVYTMLRTYLEGFENYWNYKDYKICRSPLGSTTSAT